MVRTRLFLKQKRWLFRVTCLGVALMLLKNINFNGTYFTCPDTGRYDILHTSFRRLSESVNMAAHVNDTEEYICIPNIIPADDLDHADNLNNNVEDVTWCSPSDDNNLHNLHKLTTMWHGAISIAVFTYRPNVIKTLQHLLALHQCHTHIRRRVSFHLCTRRNSTEGNIRVDPTAFDSSDVCKYSFERFGSSINYGDSKVAFPVNVLRNVAMKNTNTQYVLNTDIDMIPSNNLHELFKSFIERRSVKEKNKTVFALPCFETHVSLGDSISKKTLLEMWSINVIRPFYVKVCPQCQSNIEYGRWRSLEQNTELDIGYYRNWTENWEPFLITNRDAVPYFDERFKRYGYNRISQMCELHMNEFQFAVLDNAFLIHNGFKEKTTFHKDYAKDLAMNRQLYGDFKQELMDRYKYTGRSCFF